jgi:hypothetical protein
MVKDAWQEVVDAEVGHIFVDKFDEGLRFLIMRGPFHLCAYVGVPESHPLAGQNYDDLPIQCHGGLTFAAKGGEKLGETWPAGFYWYGWDYGHLDDQTIMPKVPGLSDRGGHKWTVSEVEGDSWQALYEFKRLVRVAERIHARAKGETIS